MKNIRSSTMGLVAAVFTGALGVTACGGSVGGGGGSTVGVTPLFDPVSALQIGVKDRTTGVYEFSSGNRIEPRQIERRYLTPAETTPELRELSRRMAKVARSPAPTPPVADPDQVVPYLETISCTNVDGVEDCEGGDDGSWYMQESGPGYTVGCEGGVSGGRVWERCWDISG